MRAWAADSTVVLERCDHNKRRACRELGISYHTLQAYLEFEQDGDPKSTDAPNGPGA